MVDPQRKSVRDVLRNPAGLNDTLFDMIAMTTTADAAPTTQTRAVSNEIMDKVDAQIAKFDAVVAGDIARLNKALAKARVGHVAAPESDRAAAYSAAVRSTSSATDGTSATPDTEWPALQMSFQRLAVGLVALGGVDVLGDVDGAALPAGCRDRGRPRRSTAAACWSRGR